MKTLFRLGWLYLFLFLLLGFMEGARADTGYALILLTYSTTDGHGLPLSSYAARFEVARYTTEKDCETAGEYALRGFRSTVQANGSRLLPAYVCEQLK